MLNVPNLLLVISGPSGAGKSTLCERFIGTSSRAEVVVTATTRPKRKNEVEGEDYFFLERREFQGRIDRGEFLEWAEVHGNLYGSPTGEVRRLLDGGRDVVLEIDVQGGVNVKKKYPDVVLIYVTPSDLGVLERRLRHRATESEEAIASRIAHARKELDSLPAYDYVLINDDLDEAVSALVEMVRTEKRRIRRYDSRKLINSLMCGTDSVDAMSEGAAAGHSAAADRRNTC